MHISELSLLLPKWQKGNIRYSYKSKSYQSHVLNKNDTIFGHLVTNMVIFVGENLEYLLNKKYS